MIKQAPPMEQKAGEVNFDGIVGPTHHYGGLSYGNIASEINQLKPSNPREAALQGLEKMKFLADRGIPQAVLPPQERPFLPVLKQLGFSGTDHAIINHVYREAPELLLAVSSAASMWAANAATISPSIDNLDERLHLTAANLTSKFHRSIEAATSSRILKAIFKSPEHFTHHEYLPTGAHFSDEGAANHTRFCKMHGEQGVQLFVYGRQAFQGSSLEPRNYPARQSYEASVAIARLHKLDANRVIFAQQHPDAIDAGAFHNDVVSVGNQNLFLFHEQAFHYKDKVINEIRGKVAKECQSDMIFLEVKANDIPLKDAVSSYLFNSQLISKADGSMMLIAPIECQENSEIKTYIEQLLSDKTNPLQEVHFLNLRQSMQNGGGPACLRLRVVMTPQEMNAAHQEVFLTEDLYNQLKKWIVKHYRDRLVIKDLSDPSLLDEGHRALDELTQLLKLGLLYDFQKLSKQ
ncbi:MAG TPA: N-succinylarginine dihydrolase [Parachlamydiaceae bacterium]|nr:N-succinylarginine dihydrolase [Parachlamydiaceae bacterium]